MNGAICAADVIAVDPVGSLESVPHIIPSRRFGGGLLRGRYPSGNHHAREGKFQWFDAAAKLTRWQRLKKHGDGGALAAYEKKTLSDRNAFQFIDQLTVKVLRHDRAKNQVEVQMTSPGRFQDTTWAVDAGALEP